MKLYKTLNSNNLITTKIIDEKSKWKKEIQKDY